MYIGSQYGKRADPSLFFVKYFTSSKRVRQMILEQGKDAFVVEKVVACEDARAFERRVLVRMYTILGKEKFMEKFINRNISPGILLDEETRARLIADPVKNAKIAATVSGNTNVRGKSWWNNGERMKRSFESPGEGWVKGALKHSEETKHKRSESNKGKMRTPEQKARYSQSRNKPGHKGNHKGTKWVTDVDGTRKRIKE